MKHLSAEQVEKLRARTLNAQEFFDVDDHLAQCDHCRSQFSQENQAQSLRKALLIDSMNDFDHLEFEQLASYVDGTLATSGQRSVEEHLKVCDLCSGEVEDLKAFQKTMPRTVQTETQKVISFQKKGSAWVWLSTVAAAIAIATTAAMVWYQNRIEVLQSRLKEVESQNEQLQSANNEVSIVFRDGPAEIRIQKDGKVTASLSIPETEQQAIRKVVEDQKFDVPPQVLKLIGNKEILMGSDDELPFSLISPVGTLVATNHPVFRWESLANANGYQVRVFDSEFHSVLQSPWIQQTEWIATQPLPAATTLIWQVAAKKQNEEIISPFAPFPDAKFLILKPDETAKVDELRNKYSGFHLILGVKYAQLGLLDDAEIEFLALQKSNPNSTEAVRLLNGIKSLRKSYSSDTESP